MFAGKNSTSYSTDDTNAEKKLKIFVCELDGDRTKNFRESLYSFLNSEDIAIKLKSDYEKALKAYQEYVETVFTTAKKHQDVVVELHDHLCKKLAIVGYNEFRHKVYVDSSGHVYIIDKDVSVTKEEM